MASPVVIVLGGKRKVKVPLCIMSWLNCLLNLYIKQFSSSVLMKLPGRT